MILQGAQNISAADLTRHTTVFQNQETSKGGTHKHVGGLDDIGARRDSRYLLAHIVCHAAAPLLVIAGAVDDLQPVRFRQHTDRLPTGIDDRRAGNALIQQQLDGRVNVVAGHKGD